MIDCIVDCSVFSSRLSDHDPVLTNFSAKSKRRDEPSKLCRIFRFECFLTLNNNKDHSSNYRPNAVLLTLSKVIENLLLLKYKILAIHQFGFLMFSLMFYCHILQHEPNLQYPLLSLKLSIV